MLSKPTLPSSADLEFSHQANRVITEYLSAALGKIFQNHEEFCGFKTPDVLRRVGQISIRDHYKDFLFAYADKKEKLLSDKTLFQSTLRPELRLLVGRIIKYFGITFYFLYLATKNTSFFSRKKREDFSILLSPDLEHYLSENIESNFFTYCQHGPLPVLRESGQILIVQDSKGQLRDLNEVKFSPQPFSLLIQKSNLTFLSLLKLYSSSAKIMLRFFSFLAVSPIFSMLYRDLAFYPAVEVLNNAGHLKNIILTNSSFFDQELWSTSLPNRKFKTVMLWYSTNTRGMNYRESSVYTEHPAVQYIQVDKSYTWNQDHANWIQSQTRTQSVEICGPILYCFPESPVTVKDFDIFVFDVTPVNQDWFDQRYTKFHYYYYNLANSKKFIDDILWVKNQLNLRPVALKHKRGHASIHSQEYITFIESKVASKEISLVLPLENLFKAIGRTKIVIVSPFSSPAYVALELKVLSIFYDPSGLLAAPAWLDPRIKFINSKEDLLYCIRGLNELIS